jgi:hypothetical protein
MIAGRFEPEDPEEEGKREDGLRTLDGAEDIRLGRALGESSAGKAETRDAEQNQQEPDHGGENSGSTVELDDGLQKELPVRLQGFAGDDGTKAATLPGRDRGARDWDVSGKGPGTGAHDMLAQAMIVGTTHARGGGGGKRHRGRITQPGSGCRKAE